MPGFWLFRTWELFSCHVPTTLQRERERVLASHQDKLQSSCHRVVEFASTPGGTRAYQKYLFKIPIVVTVNYSTKNLDYLQNHDWLKHESNRVVVRWPEVLHEARGQAV